MGLAQRDANPSFSDRRNVGHFRGHPCQHKGKILILGDGEEAEDSNDSEDLEKNHWSFLNLLNLLSPMNLLNPLNLLDPIQSFHIFGLMSDVYGLSV